MNQILMSDRIYDTPAARKKRRLYKNIFVFSILVIAILISYYIYGEYQRSKGESVSKEILNEISFGYASDTTVQDDSLIIGLDSEVEDTQVQSSNIQDMNLNESNKYTVYVS